MADAEPVDLPTFTVELHEAPDLPERPAYGYQVHVDYPPDEVHPLGRHWDSEVAALNASTALAARAEARERTTLVMALILGASVESLEPRGVGDDGRMT